MRTLALVNNKGELGHPSNMPWLPWEQHQMDGKWSWRDNLFIERLWKSVKCEDVYLHAYDSVPEARHGLARSFTFCNQGRPHSDLDGQTPDMVYFVLLPQLEAA